jgi:hypothetical protein
VSTKVEVCVDREVLFPVFTAAGAAKLTDERFVLEIQALSADAAEIGAIVEATRRADEIKRVLFEKRIFDTYRLSARTHH